MALVCGIDFGVRNLRIVLMDCGHEDAPEGYGSVLGTYTFGVNHRTVHSELERKYKLSLEKAGLAKVDYVASTGFGGKEIEFADRYIYETVCHAKGAAYLYAETRTVLILGAMNTYALKTETGGRIRKFVFNKRCASASGIFLENVCKHLGTEIDEIGKISTMARRSAPVSNLCAILGGIDIVNSISRGTAREEILKGAHDAIVDRAIPMLKGVGLESELTITGGIAKNEGVVECLRERLGREGGGVRINADPTHSPYAGAIGAALLGRSRLHQLSC